jgi:hypothetical protein
MAATLDDVPAEPGDPSAPAYPDQGEIRAHETRNLWTLALHQVVLRIGWTFKTESIIAPFILDTVMPKGWLRGCLPLANRLGQSIPPVFSAGLLAAMPRKKWALAGLAALVGLPYLMMAGIWLGTGDSRTLAVAAAFLAIQFVFYVFYGLYQVSFGTVQGKLIRPTRRGRLLWGATFWGLFPTIVFCRWLMPGWLAVPTPGFGYLFLFIGASLVISGAIVCAIAEPADRRASKPATARASVGEMIGSLRRDKNLRRLVVLILLLYLGLVTIPHYQAFAKEQLGSGARDLVFMVITHTTAVSVYSLFVGPVADRWGNRLTLRVLILGAAIAPAYTLALPWVAGGLSREWFWVVFIPLALTPIVPTILFNYALEMCSASEHPRYVSTVNFAMMPPFLLSPLVGTVVDLAGFKAVCVGTCALMLFCGALTFWLDEPRHAAPSAGERIVPSPEDAAAQVPPLRD